MLSVVTMGLMECVKNAPTVDYEDRLSTALGKLRKLRTSLVVRKDRKYYGMLDDREIWSRYPGKTKAGSLAVKAPVLYEDSGDEEAVEYFITGKFKALPVMKSNKVVGIITRADMMRELAKNPLLERVKVKDVMSAPVISIDSDSTVAQARAKMRKSGITHLVVVEREKAVGTFSTYDFAVRSARPRERLPLLARKKRPMDAQPVSSFLRKYDGIEPGASLRECAHMMADHDISEVVVVVNKKPAGIVVANDIFRLFTGKPEPAVEVSGLDAEDRSYMQDVIAQAKKSLNKLDRSFNIERLMLHVKKHGSRRYSVNAKLIGKHMTAVSSQAWNLYDAVKQSLDEIRKKLMREKRQSRKPKRTRKGSPR